MAKRSFDTKMETMISNQQLHHSPRAVDPSSMKTTLACDRDGVFFESKLVLAAEK